MRLATWAPLGIAIVVHGALALLLWHGRTLVVATSPAALQLTRPRVESERLRFLAVAPYRAGRARASPSQPPPPPGPALVGVAPANAPALESTNSDPASAELADSAPAVRARAMDGLVPRFSQTVLWATVPIGGLVAPASTRPTCLRANDFRCFAAEYRWLRDSLARVAVRCRRDQSQAWILRPADCPAP